MGEKETVILRVSKTEMEDGGAAMAVQFWGDITNEDVILATVAVVVAGAEKIDLTLDEVIRAVQETVGERGGTWRTV